MSFVLVLTMCTSFASTAIHGRPGACMTTQEVVIEDARGDRKVFSSYEDCNAEFQVQRRLGRFSYVYVGVFADRRVTTNRVWRGQCLRV